MSVTPLSSGAIIRRVNRPADQFTMVSNGFARDMRLSFFARGLGLWLMSHIDGFETTATSLARQAGIGRDQVRRALVELEHHRYLRRTRVRTDAGAFGAMVYLVQCTPFPPDPEEENPSSHQRLEYQAQAPQSPAGAHHKKTSPKDNTPHEEHPSGGSPTGERGAPADLQEEPVKHPPGMLALDLELPEPAQEIRPKQAGKNAAGIVAAFVDSYRQHHSGGDPLQRDKGRVARDAAELLRTQRATFDELTEAATAMGSGRFSNLGVQLNITRERHSGTRTSRGPVPASSHEEFVAASQESHHRFLEQIRTDPATARWVADDPQAVDNLCKEDPSLRAVFAAAMSAA